MSLSAANTFSRAIEQNETRRILMNTFDYFKQICKIPRESGNEEGMRQYLLSWANEKGFEAIRDKAGNIIIRTGATTGYENAPSVALQGHMDMVCVKVPNSAHNFLTDPIDVYEDGDFLRARGTSLGGDDGIAVAMVQSLFTDTEAKHGPLEAIFTFSEETGMDGAFSLDGSLIRSRRMINIDSEEEGVIYIGCAGGIDLVGKASYDMDDVPSDWDTVEIFITGLKGGHSGGEIHQQRLNAISALSRIMVTLGESGVPFMIGNLHGGIRRNVIPFQARCTFALPSSAIEGAKSIIEKTVCEIKEENKYEEPDFTVETKDSVHGAIRLLKAVDPDLSMLVTKALFACPHGVFAMSKALPGIVETSNNLAIVKFEHGQLEIQISVRSNIDSAKYLLVNKIRVIFESFGLDCKIGDGYPSWAPNPNSELANFCADAYEQLTGKKPTVTAIHAGLECGVINSKCPGMDSISIGPNMYDVHSVNEHISISSTKRMYDFIKYMLSTMK